MIKTLDPLTFQADHHTDLWIAQRVMGWPIIRENKPFAHYLGHGGVIVVDRPQIFRFSTIPDAFMPSSKIEDAVEVLRKMRDLGWSYIVDGDPSVTTTLVMFSRGQYEDYTAIAETESLAICRAAGLAITGQKHDH